MIFQIDESTPYPTFPDPRAGDEDGLFAVGGDLSIDRLLLAYCHGIFPWYSFRDQPDILWYCPMQRFVIFPEEIHVSHSMRTLINKDQYSFSINEAFDDVIAQCSKLRIEQDGAWLGDDMIKAYTELHRQGFASSVEVWDDATDQLVGGLYGVTIGPVFIGESMFSLVPSASKLALIYLARFMQRKGMKLIDCQLETSHLRSMGGRFIGYDDYLKIINDDERVCHKSVTHPFLFFHLSSNTKKENFIFIYNKAQTFTSSGFAFPQKKYIFAENFLKYGKDTNKI